MELKHSSMGASRFYIKNILSFGCFRFNQNTNQRVEKDKLRKKKQLKHITA